MWKAVEILSTPLLVPQPGIGGENIMNSYLTTQLKLLYQALTALFRLQPAAMAKYADTIVDAIVKKD